MAQMMRQMGIAQEQISATEVIIKTPENEIVISNPEVLKVHMGGQVTFQIAGEIQERHRELEISQDDVQTVMDQTGATQEEVQAAIAESNGDLAKAILSLNGEESGN